jgi:hypothetical protein
VELEGWRDFLIYALPNLWAINGGIITYDQTIHAHRRFTGKGRFSEIYRKHFIDFDPLFTPSRLEHDNSSGTIWSIDAKNLLFPLPNHFNMGVERDIWRFTRMAKELESLMSSDEQGDIATSICAFISIPSSASSSQIENDHNSRVMLLILLLGSLFPDFQPEVLQAVLEYIFDQRPWTHHSITPLKWSLQQRIYFCHLLVARLSIVSPLGKNI